MNRVNQVASRKSSTESYRQQFEAEAMPHLNDLFRTAMRLVRDRTRAEDLVQETFLQAWKSFHRFEANTNCRAWLYKILFHIASHHRRRLFRFPLVQENKRFIESTLTYTAPVPDSLTDEDILAALDKLPSAFRDVVLLADVQEFTYGEAAEILGIPIGTVMSRLSRGRNLLRGYLAEMAGKYGIGTSGRKT